MTAGWIVTSAIAPTFDWVSSSPDLVLTFPSAPSPVNVSVPSAPYRMLLGSSTGDFIRAAQTKINNAMAGAGRAETFVLGLNEDGRCVLSISSGTFTAAVGPLLRELGWLTQPVAVSSTTADYQPRRLILMVCAYDGVWQPQQDGATELTAGGVVYSFGGSNTSYQREIQTEKIPWNPTRAAEAECPATPWEPDMGYQHALGSSATNRPWSILDVLVGARNAVCGVTLGDFQDLRSSTSTRYYLGQVVSILSPKPEREDAKWPRFLKHKMSLVLPAGVNTATRA